MNRDRLTLRHKLLLAIGLNAFFYSVLMYVNLNGEDRKWSALLGNSLPILASEYLIGTLIVFGWLYLAEWIHEVFERRFGEEIISKGGFWPNLGALVTFAAANIVVNIFTVKLIFCLQQFFLDRPDIYITADTEYARFSLRFNYVLYSIMAMLVYYLLTFKRVVRRLQEAKLRAEKAEKERIESEYEQLRTRANPHFLFNSLSTLSSLVRLDVERSEQFVEHLSRAYRYLLEHRNLQTVPLQSEINFIKDYSFLQETRFPQKLRIEIEDIGVDAAQKEVIPLTLQVLIERAMKYNRMSVQSPLVIQIRTTATELIVENNRQLRSEPDNHISGFDWSAFESRYAQLTLLEHPVQDRAKATKWSTQVPLIAPTAATPQ